MIRKNSHLAKRMAQRKPTRDQKTRGGKPPRATREMPISLIELSALVREVGCVIERTDFACTPQLALTRYRVSDVTTLHKCAVSVWSPRTSFICNITNNIQKIKDSRKTFHLFLETKSSILSITLDRTLIRTGTPSRWIALRQTPFVLWNSAICVYQRC